MGIDPDYDKDILVQNGTFDSMAYWTWGDNWSRPPNYAAFTRDLPYGFELYQPNLPLVLGNYYQIDFTISNYNFPFSGGGLTVNLRDSTAGPVFKTNGQHTIKLLCIDKSNRLHFEIVNAQQLDYLELDDVSITRLGDYPGEHRYILPVEPWKKEWWDLGGGDYMIQMSGYKDHTKCQIKYRVT